ncbi:MAG: hypothetical protein GX779_06925 [Clostridia bacterium]|nr:hypothetical protein [Clostridia bacterium]
MSTVLCGKEEDVWSAVQDMFHTARQIHQQSILTVTFSDCCGCSKVD